MYEGSVDFTNETAIPLLAMADFYQIKELRHAASDYLLSSITRENALLVCKRSGGGEKGEGRRAERKKGRGSYLMYFIRCCRKLYTSMPRR